MRPLAPPPHFRHSRNNRKKQASTESDTLVHQSNLAKSWVPFDHFENDDNCKYFGNEVSINPFFSSEGCEEETGVEAQLTSRNSNNNDALPCANNNDGSPRTNHISGSFSDFENIAPIPLPSSLYDNGPVCEPGNRNTDTDRAMMVGSNRNQPLGSLQPISNQRVVQRKGLGKRTNNVPKISAKPRNVRGVSVENQQRGRTKLADKIQRRSSRSLSVLPGKKQKQKNSRRLSITRHESDRHDNSQLDENQGQEKEDDINNRNSVPPIEQTTVGVRDQMMPVVEMPPRNQCVDSTSMMSYGSGSGSGSGSVCDDSSFSSTKLPSVFRTRNLLPTSVYHNNATGIWITTINMSQKETVNKSNAAKYLKAFSFQTEHEARESAYANAPARMLPFVEHPFCFICCAQFSVFKRASHCRNCGVCICSTCSTSWKRVCVPETYNIKGEASIRICKSCDALSKQFRTALLEGNFDNALKIYNSGNVNLRCPFMATKGAEIMLPIHCAAEGGCLDLLVWLVEVHYCPLKRIRTGNRHKSQQADEMITTSKGRTVLDIAMAGKNVDIIRYLVNDKGIDIYCIKDFSLALSALEAVLKSPYMIPLCDDNDRFVNSINQTSSRIMRSNSDLTGIDNGLPTFSVGANDDLSDNEEESPRNEDGSINSEDEQSVATTVPDAVSITKCCLLVTKKNYIVCNISRLCSLLSALYATQIQLTVSLLPAAIKYAAYNAQPT